MAAASDGITLWFVEPKASSAGLRGRCHCRQGKRIELRGISPLARETGMAGFQDGTIAWFVERWHDGIQARAYVATRARD